MGMDGTTCEKCDAESVVLGRAHVKCVDCGKRLCKRCWGTYCLKRPGGLLTHRHAKDKRRAEKRAQARQI